MNQAILMGNLGADPELRMVGNGTACLKMRLATTSRRKIGDKWEDHTEWHQVTVWGKRAEGLAKILSKGRRILVTGEIRTRSYESEGVKRYSTEIHADEVELCDRSRDEKDDRDERPRRDDRRDNRRQERPARNTRDEEPASDPFAAYGGR